MIFMAFLFLLQAPAGNTRPASASTIQRDLKTNPSWQEGWWELGTLYYQQDRYPECRDAFKQLSKLAPKSGPAWTMLGLCEFGAKQFDAALLHLRQGQDLRVGNDSIDTVAKFHLAQVYTHIGNFETALGILADLAQHKDENASYIMASGIAALWTLETNLPGRASCGGSRAGLPGGQGLLGRRRAQGRGCSERF